MRRDQAQWLRGGNCSRCGHRGEKCKARCEPKEARDMAGIKKAMILAAIRRREGE